MQRKEVCWAHTSGGWKFSDRLGKVLIWPLRRSGYTTILWWMWTQKRPQQKQEPGEIEEVCSFYYDHEELTRLWRKPCESLLRACLCTAIRRQMSGHLLHTHCWKTLEQSVSISTWLSNTRAPILPVFVCHGFPHFKFPALQLCSTQIPYVSCSALKINQLYIYFFLIRGKLTKQEWEVQA